MTVFTTAALLTFGISTFHDLTFWGVGVFGVDFLLLFFGILAGGLKSEASTSPISSPLPLVLGCISSPGSTFTFAEAISK